MLILKTFKFLSLDDQKWKIPNFNHSNSNNYNLSNYTSKNALEFEKNIDEKKDHIGQKLVKFLVLNKNLKNYISKTYCFPFKISATFRLAYYTTLKKLQIKFLSPLIMQPSNYYTLNLFIPKALTLYLLISKELYPLAIFPKIPVST